VPAAAPRHPDLARDRLDAARPVAFDGRMMFAGTEIAVATQDDLPGILALQDENQPDRGGVLSVRLPHEWFTAAIAARRVVVARRDGKPVGYLAAEEVATQMHLPIMQAMLRAYPASPNAFLHGPICVAQSERGRGLAGALFQAALDGRQQGRESVTFIRSDNAPSLRAHVKMGMNEVAVFTHDGVELVVLARAG
jgi:L-amino acid N-acyltransferase YncA